jgi:hypothetical protein
VLIVGMLGSFGGVPARVIAAVLGATIGGGFGGLIGMGIPATDVGLDENRISPLKILISVQTHNPEEITRATNAFATAGAQDICTVDEENEI